MQERWPQAVCRKGIPKSDVTALTSLLDLDHLRCRCRWVAKPIPSHHHARPVDAQANALQHHAMPAPCYASGWPSQHHALPPLLAPQLPSEIQVWLVQPGTRPLAKAGPFFSLSVSLGCAGSVWLHRLSLLAVHGAALHAAHGPLLTVASPAMGCKR